jgi:hypothetical protein
MKTLGMTLEVKGDPSNGQAKLRRRMQDIVDAVNACSEAKAHLGAAMLLYAGIDGLAWLSRPTTAPDVRPEDFKTWVRDYLLPDSGLACSDEDLYSARCALLHTQTAESRASRSGQAKPLWYGVDKGQAYVPVMASSPLLAELIELKDLLGAFQSAMERFLRAIETDASLQARVLERAVEYFDLARIGS